MSAAIFTINPQFSLSVRKMGEEQTPLVIIDNLMVDTQPLIQQICQQNDFNQVQKNYYPGVRSDLNRDYVIAVLQAVYQQIGDIYQVPLELKLKPLTSYYSLINKSANELVLLQRLPHFDSHKPYFFALLHYLDPSKHGNTGFFRHKPTGFESINKPRVENYLASASAFIKQHGEPEQQYMTESNEHFELYEQVEYKANRLIIYPGNLLHSSLVNPQTDIDANPATGRLTANIFIDFQ
ncbi:DUF6445 family protein [Paraglaciecola sp.]|uniref:DUF6445 family protein n=1 Tax=Paraglaciecola sp. TaxID=1920173 RepID=UPI0030F386AE